jgi:steroid 5-alpha reductase family enzyme
MPKTLKIILAILLILLISGGLMVAGSQHSLALAGLPLFFILASVGFVLHWIMFIPAYLFQTERYFDLTGSLSFIGTVLLAALLHPSISTRGLVICLLVAIWALRLGSFLFNRIRKDGKDRRFDEIKTQFWRFLLTWTLGGAWVFLTLAAGLAAITSNDSVAADLYLFVGVAIWLSGFAIEVIADAQKSRFRSQSDNKQCFITSGLWRYSRHPNYFGEIVLWIGIAVIALPVLQGWQWLCLISPLFVILLLTRISGIPMLEKSARERWGSDPDYQHYVENTPVLIPAPQS